MESIMSGLKQRPLHNLQDMCSMHEYLKRKPVHPSFYKSLHSTLNKFYKFKPYLIHGDLHAGNIIVVYNTNTREVLRLKIIDYGSTYIIPYRFQRDINKGILTSPNLPTIIQHRSDFLFSHTNQPVRYAVNAVIKQYDRHTLQLIQDTRKVSPDIVKLRENYKHEIQKAKNNAKTNILFHANTIPQDGRVIYQRMFNKSGVQFSIGQMLQRNNAVLKMVLGSPHRSSSSSTALPRTTSR